MEEQNLQQPNEENVEMSEIGTITSIFFEPGRTFESLRRKPKFILGLILTIFLSIGFWVAVSQKIQIGNFFIEQLKKSPQYEKMDTDAREKTINFYKSPLFTGLFLGFSIVGLVITTFLGGLIYWLATNAMGGTITYLRGVSVWTYSTFAPLVITVFTSLIVLFLKSTDEIDATSLFQRGGIVHANPTMFIDVSKSPVLNVILSSIDLFQIWGLILAAIGLKVVGKISSVSAWSIVLTLKLILLTISVVWVAIFGNGS